MHQTQSLGHLIRFYPYPFAARSSRTKPDQSNRTDAPPEPLLDCNVKPDDQDIAVRLARAETALDAEREKTAMMERYLGDVRRMLPPPDAEPRRRWWPW